MASSSLLNFKVGIFSMPPAPIFNANLDPRVVVGQHGWWQGCAELGAPAYDPFGREGANFNLLNRIVPICARFNPLRKKSCQGQFLHRDAGGIQGGV